MSDSLIARQRYLFPQLRPDVSISEKRRKSKDGGSRTVYSLALADGRQIKSDERTITVLQLMTGYRHLDEIIERASELEIELSLDDLSLLLEEYMAFGAVELNQSKLLPQTFAPTEFRFEAATRYDHGHCTDACSRMKIGPIPVSYTDWLAEQPAISAHPSLGGQELFEPLADDPEMMQVRHRDGACIFQEGERCIIEQQLGYAAIPQPCRGLPFQLMRTPFGAFYHLDPVDRRVFDAYSDGPDLNDPQQQERLILALHDFPGRRFRRSEVLLLSDYRVVFQVYLRIEDKIIKAIDERPEQSVIDLLQQVITAIVWLPSIAPQLTNVIEAVHDLRFDDLRLQGPFWEGFWYCHAPVVHNLLRYLKRKAGDGLDLEGEPPQTLRERDRYEIYHSLKRLRKFWESGEPESLQKLIVEPACYKAMLYTIRQLLFGKQFLLYPNLAAALVAMLFGYFVIRVGSDLRVESRGDTFRQTDDFTGVACAWFSLLRDDQFRDLLSPRDELERFFGNI